MAAAAASFGAPTGAAAQTFASLGGTEPGSVVAAEQLEARARDLSAGPRWSSAARLYRNAADLRGAGDLATADNLRLAGYIRYYEGSTSSAVSALEEAADAYLIVGDVVGAAGTLTDAAWVAARDGRLAVATTLRERALLLTRSPLLDTMERETLTRRLGN